MCAFAFLMHAGAGFGQLPPPGQIIVIHAGKLFDAESQRSSTIPLMARTHAAPGQSGGNEQ